jgi:hypothetical protein
VNIALDIPQKRLGASIEGKSCGMRRFGAIIIRSKRRKIENFKFKEIGPSSVLGGKAFELNVAGVCACRTKQRTLS